MLSEGKFIESFQLEMNPKVKKFASGKLRIKEEARGIRPGLLLFLLCGLYALSFSLLCATDSISLIRFSWFTSDAPGS